jgi:hypothetical protein
MVGFCLSGCTNSLLLSEEQILEGRFELGPSGYVKQWLVVEPQYRPHYEGRTESGRMTVDQVEWTESLPEDIGLGSPGPFGGRWRYHRLGENIFMEINERVPTPSAGRMYAAVDLDAPRAKAVYTRLWISGWVTLWLNGERLGKFHGRRHLLSLSLREGRNRLVAYMQNGGLRGILLKIGLQMPYQVGKIRVMLPGPQDKMADLERAEYWLSTLGLVDGRQIKAAAFPPFPVKVVSGNHQLDWAEDQPIYILPRPDLFSFRVTTEVNGHRLERYFEIPSNKPIVRPDAQQDLEAHRLAYIKKIADMSYPTVAMSKPSRSYLFEGIVRHLLGQVPVEDPQRLQEALDKIEKHIASADFDMIIALRFYCLGAGTERDRERIKQAALGFRYWRDEPGEDNLCFHSENHRVMFHGSQLIAGRLWPDDIFANSGKSGRQQAELGRRRCLEWLADLEEDGFEEFLSSAYVAITMSAAMNLVDFSGDAEISQRAGRLVDRMFRMMAEHSFDGIAVGPQGRCYRDFIYPQTTSGQAVLSYATPAAVESLSPWILFLASSPQYRPPTGLERLMQTPIRKRYHEWHYLVNLYKTADYMLSSVEIPNRAADYSDTGPQMWPGHAGYQQHIGHATLGTDCHIFVTHPGAANALSPRRPGFWYGCGSMPRQTQRDDMLMQIFNIPHDHPIQFTHAHWPSDAFDEWNQQENWFFGQKGSGYIGLWCSRTPELLSQVLTDRELRAWGPKTAWIWICSGQNESGSFRSFKRQCRRLEPSFDPVTLTLKVSGHKPLRWDEAR